MKNTEIIEDMNQENLKNKLEEKDEKKEKYNQELNDIKNHYQVEFVVYYSKNNNVERIKFLNLSYKKKIENITLIYDNRIGKFNFLSYKLEQNFMTKNLIDKTIISTINKEKKLNLVIAEVLRLSKEYKQELEKIDRKYKKRIDRKKVEN